MHHTVEIIAPSKQLSLEVDLARGEGVGVATLAAAAFAGPPMCLFISRHRGYIARQTAACIVLSKACKACEYDCCSSTSSYERKHRQSYALRSLQRTVSSWPGNELKSFSLVESSAPYIYLHLLLKGRKENDGSSRPNYMSIGQWKLASTDEHTMHT
eukprot:1154344-Pelagomonas_calceolata.AAC.3